MEHLIWAVPAALWILVSIDAANRQKPLLLLDRTHKLCRALNTDEHELAGNRLLGLRGYVAH